jgi:hypothetical protein
VQSLVTSVPNSSHLGKLIDLRKTRLEGLDVAAPATTTTRSKWLRQQNGNAQTIANTAWARALSHVSGTTVSPVMLVDKMEFGTNYCDHGRLRLCAELGNGWVRVVRVGERAATGPQFFGPYSDGLPPVLGQKSKNCSVCTPITT